MKLSSLFAAGAALIILTASCGLLVPGLAGTGAATPAATSIAATNGQASGVALKNLYTQYKADGKLDMTNISNIINMASLVSGMQGFKDKNVDPSFYKDFATGLILGSDNLVNKNNSKSILSTIGALAGTDLSSVTSIASTLAGQAASSSAAKKSASTVSSAANVISAVSQLNSIFNQFK